MANDTNDTNGSDEATDSTNKFISALILNLIIALICLILFCLLRQKHKIIYAPRQLLVIFPGVGLILRLTHGLWSQHGHWETSWSHFQEDRCEECIFKWWEVDRRDFSRPDQRTQKTFSYPLNTARFMAFSAIGLWWAGAENTTEATNAHARADYLKPGQRTAAGTSRHHCGQRP